MANPLYQQIKISEPKSYTGEESAVSLYRECLDLVLTERQTKEMYWSSFQKFLNAKLSPPEMISIANRALGTNNMFLHNSFCKAVIVESHIAASKELSLPLFFSHHPRREGFKIKIAAAGVSAVHPHTHLRMAAVADTAQKRVADTAVAAAHTAARIYLSRFIASATPVLAKKQVTSKADLSKPKYVLKVSELKAAEKIFWKDEMGNGTLCYI